MPGFCVRPCYRSKCDNLRLPSAWLMLNLSAAAPAARLLPEPAEYLDEPPCVRERRFLAYELLLDCPVAIPESQQDTRTHDSNGLGQLVQRRAAWIPWEPDQLI